MKSPIPFGKPALALVAGLIFAAAQARAATDISVHVEIACHTSVGCETNWSKAAGANVGSFECPEFCYRFAVTNTGSLGLWNITVTDSAFGDLTHFFNFPATFAPGDFRTVLVTAVTICSDLTNVVLAVGQETASSQTVTNRDTAVARALRFEGFLDCELLLTSPDDADGNPNDGRITFPPDGDPHFVTNSVRVCNLGNTELTNVRITDPPLEASGAACSNSIRSINFNLPAGACRTVALCTVFVPECYGPSFHILVTVTAQVSPPMNGYCAQPPEGGSARSEYESTAGCAAIQLSRGAPGVRSGQNLAQVGPQLDSPCGRTGVEAKWFKIAKDPYYPEGVAEISTEGSDYDTLVSVYSGPLTSPTNLLLLGCNDDASPSNHQSRVSFQFPPPGSGAGPYWLVVDGKGNTNGNVTLVYGYAPALESYRFNSSNHFELRSSVGLPLAYQLQASSNLALHALGWVKLLATNLTTNQTFFEFADTNAPQFRQRYYRIVPSAP